MAAGKKRAKAGDSVGKRAAKVVGAPVVRPQNPGRKTARPPAPGGKPKNALDGPSVMASVKGDGGNILNIDVERQKILFDELEDLARYIRAAKHEIARLRPDEVKEQYLPAATDELDAIVEATAEATNTIMDAVEVVEGVMSDVTPAHCARLMDATTHIYEACSFQDITGQRIGKVVNTLKHIEEKIDDLVLAFGDEIELIKKNTPKKQNADKIVTDQDLLEGPQLGDAAKSQSEIDELLASFD